MYTTLFWIIIAILIADFILEYVLDRLNDSYVKEELPAEMVGIYDAEKYKKQQRYFKTNQKFGKISDAFSFLVIMCMFFFFGFAFVDNLARGAAESEIMVSLIFFGILYFANELISLPFGYYDTFKIEEKFGFNKMTKKLFFFDTLKEWSMSIVIGGVILALLILFYQYAGKYFWVIAWCVVAVINVFMMMFYSNLIVPLFNKQTPLPEGELRSDIENFCKKVGYELENLYVIDGSKRSTKANAYFTGLGKKKRIVLFDTLMDTLTNEEIVAVLAHEIGHYKHKHTRMMLAASLINMAIMFYLLSLALGTPEEGNIHIAQALGGNIPSFHFGVIVFGILYAPLSTLLNVGMNAISRKNEYQADAFARDNGLAIPLSNALKKLSVSSLSNLNPHPAYVFFHYSHPTLLQRLENLKSAS